MLEELGFIGTIGEDDEVPVEPESDSGDEEEEVGADRGWERSGGRSSFLDSVPFPLIPLLCPQILSIPQPGRRVSFEGSHRDPKVFLSWLATSFSSPPRCAVPFRVALASSGPTR